ncbi:MAG: hypothetical protein K2K99_04010, partial [Muribaculaceae bacterium]|nr:hypothetical protein [Muribaculaceae bacterium]
MKCSRIGFYIIVFRRIKLKFIFQIGIPQQTATQRISSITAQQYTQKRSCASDQKEHDKTRHDRQPKADAQRNLLSDKGLQQLGGVFSHVSVKFLPLWGLGL